MSERNINERVKTKYFISIVTVLFGGFIYKLIVWLQNKRTDDENRYWQFNLIQRITKLQLMFK